MGITMTRDKTPFKLDCAVVDVLSTHSVVDQL